MPPGPLGSSRRREVHQCSPDAPCGNTNCTLKHLIQHAGLNHTEEGHNQAFQFQCGEIVVLFDVKDSDKCSYCHNTFAVIALVGFKDPPKGSRDLGIQEFKRGLDFCRRCGRIDTTTHALEGFPGVGENALDFLEKLAEHAETRRVFQKTELKRLAKQIEETEKKLASFRSRENLLKHRLGEDTGSPYRN